MESLCFEKIQRQVMGQDPVPKFGLRTRDDLVRFGKPLNVSCNRDQRTVEKLDRADL
jgi:hypothetical protein